MMGNGSTAMSSLEKTAKEINTFLVVPLISLQLHSTVSHFVSCCLLHVALGKN